MQQKFYIKKDSNGAPSGFLISEENLISLNHTPESLINHPEFYEVQRSERPVFSASEYKVVDTEPTFTVINGVVSETWGVRDMTSDEKELQTAAENQAALKVANDLLDISVTQLSQPNITPEIHAALTDNINQLEKLINDPTISMEKVFVVTQTVQSLLN